MNSLSIQYAEGSVLLAVGLLALWLLLRGSSIMGLPARAILSLTGHLRARPDPWLEGALRAAFAEFDRELALILKDRIRPVPIRRDRSRSPNVPPGTSRR